MAYIPAADGRFEVARMHLERFWNEIVWRRETEQKITVWTVGFLSALLALVYGSDEVLKCGQKVALSLLSGILGSLSAWYLALNWWKSKQISGLIVKLNDSLGAWEPGYLIPGESLYPEKWRQWGLDPSADESRLISELFKDKVSCAYSILVLLASGLVVVGILLK